MKEIYLAMDKDGVVFGYGDMPVVDSFGAWWHKKDAQYGIKDLENLGIDVTKFTIQHETPIKIRAVWEVCDET